MSAPLLTALYVLLTSPPLPPAAASAVFEPCGVPLRRLFSREALEPPLRLRRRYRLPSGVERGALMDSLRAATEDDPGLVLAWAAVARYDVCRLDGDGEILVWRPPRGEGRAVVALRLFGARPIIFEVPHPYYDAGTGSQGVLLFEHLDARALIYSGTHRCASARLSGCQGTTAPCGPGPQPHRISDVAHSPHTNFQAAHEVLTGAFEDDWVISVHGMASPGVSLSNGTTRPAPPDAPVARLYGAFQAAFPNAVITTCNGLPFARRTTRYCGTTNIQGRETNGSSDPCHRGARRASERFVHLEQSLQIRSRSLDVIEVLDRVAPH